MSTVGDPVDDAIYQAMARGKAGDIEGAWAALRPFRDAAGDDPRVAYAWLVLAKNCGEPERHREMITRLGKVWARDPHIANLAATALDSLVEGRGVDDRVPADDPSHDAASIARAALESLRSTGDARLGDARVGGALWWTLGNALRLAGREHDAEAAHAFDQAAALHPGNPWLAFDRGLLHKFAGEHAEALACFGAVLEEEPSDEAALNNLAVCATITGAGELAASAWSSLGYEVELGDDGLPCVTGAERIKLRLPVERGPVDFEGVWLDPESPCHGRVLNPPAYSRAVAFGDVVAFDRHQVGWAELSDSRRPEFPFLARLRPSGATTALFVAADAAVVDDARARMPRGAALYRFDSGVVPVCDPCVRGLGAHDQHPSPTGGGAIHGALLIDPGTALAEVRAALASLALACPDLDRLTGDDPAPAMARWTELVG